jgi:hypothetical protein
MSDNENEFEFEGKTYVAVDDDMDLVLEGTYGCDQCAFKGVAMCGVNRKSCMSEDFRDRDIHFEEKQ